jgi:hypothetical protein
MIIKNHEETGRWKTMPAEIFDHPGLSPVTRATLGWILTRPDGWELVIGPMLMIVGISEHIWLKTVRPELMEHGYLLCDKFTEKGRVVWIYTVVSRPSQPY